MYNLNTYKNEITAISKANGNVDVGVATDMFIANIHNAGKPELPHYEGAGNVDYTALRPHLGELVDSKAEFLEAWSRELGYLK